MVTDSPERLCRRLAAAQDALLHRRQAVACGMTKSAIGRRVASGTWRTVLPAVYLLDGAPFTWERRVRAASLWAGRSSALSHESAAALWKLEGFAPGPIVASTCRSLKPVPGVRIHRVSAIGPADVGDRDGIIVTSPARTLFDLAGTHPGKVEVALDGALHCGLVSLPRLRWFVRTHAGRGRPGSAVMRSLLSARPDGYVPPESPLEGKVWSLLRRTGLPPPVRQHRVLDGGRVIARVDLAYPDAMVAIEVDGYRWHSGWQAWRDDLARRNRLTALGWRVLHVTHDDLVARPDGIVDHLRALLSARSLSRGARSAGP
jgi:very-short-patch-repair endonuclease